jgi:hypothetical protein
MLILADLQCPPCALQFILLGSLANQNLFCTLPVNFTWFLLVECVAPVVARMARGAIDVWLVLHYLLSSGKWRNPAMLIC